MVFILNVSTNQLYFYSIHNIQISSVLAFLMRDSCSNQSKKSEEECWQTNISVNVLHGGFKRYPHPFIRFKMNVIELIFHCYKQVLCFIFEVCIILLACLCWSSGGNYYTMGNILTMCVLLKIFYCIQP